MSSSRNRGQASNRIFHFQSHGPQKPGPNARLVQIHERNETHHYLPLDMPYLETSIEISEMVNI